MIKRYEFASDNTAGICPEAWTALQEANQGFLPSYGDDVWTTRAADLLREIFETDCEVFFVFNGTTANSLTLAHLCQPFHSVICHEIAHIEKDECGAPEFFSNGSKILLAPGAHGKMQAAAVEELILARTDIHYPKPRVLSLTQATELGTVYQPDEVQTLTSLAHRHGLSVHMDGARFANAVASLGCSPAEITWKAGVDVLCFGGTKNGLPASEAVIFFDKTLACEFDYRCKQGGELCSKMRFLSAPLVGVLRDGAWLRHASHANACARRLSQGFAELPGFRLAEPTEANAVFVEIAPERAEELEKRGWVFYGGTHFYPPELPHRYRFMCSWQTTEAMVDELLRDAAADS